jgi:fructan beta-fructosidase
MIKSLLYSIPLLMMMACTPAQKENVSGEQHRPQFHFTPPSGWMNDPNGMVYANGEYHLFYQHYPDSTVWGPMHWGHAISKDLIHWEHHPIALYPDTLGFIFSGSAVLDINNSSGFQSGINNPLVAIFTYDKKGYETQGIAHSNNLGRTWTKYDNNPVIKNPGEQDYRDPKVFWHQESEHWIMSLAVKNRIEFYRSKNLTEWEKTGEFGRDHGNHGGVWECPDMFLLSVEGTDETKWVLLVSINPGAPNGGSGTQYFIGQFDGTTFTSDNEPATELWIDYGKDNYAGVTWSNTPDNRIIFLGWMSNWQYANIVPTESWRSAMTLPRDLSLRNTPSGIRLVSTPSPELVSLRGLKSTLDFSSDKKHSGLIEVYVEVDLKESTAVDFGIEVFNSKNEKVRIGYTKPNNQFYIDRTLSGKTDFSEDFAGVQYAPRLSDNSILSLHLFIDVASAELFADDGSTCLTSIFFPNEDFTEIRLYQQGGEAKLVTGELYELKPIW